MNTEQPSEVGSALKLQQAAVALQYTQRGGLPDDVKSCRAEDAYCNHYHSYEKDLLSHAFRNPPPVRSYCISNTTAGCQLGEYALAARLILPRRLRFKTEGNTYERYRRGVPSLDVTLSFSRHDFLQSDRVVFNLVVHIDCRSSPDTFGEYELLCLSKLWCAQDESETWVIDGDDEGVRFDIGGEHLRPAEVAARYLGVKRERPVGGCLQIAFNTVKPGEIAEPCVVAEGEASVTPRELIDALNAIQKEDAGQPKARLVQPLKAIGCLLQNIFDIENVDLNELDDMLDGISTSRSAVTAIHRNSLFALTLDDRLFDDVAHTIGMSPYLLLPQAVLLHNEAILFEANTLLRHTDRVADRLGKSFDRDIIRQRLVDALCADSLDDLPGGPDWLIRKVVRRLWKQYCSSREASFRAPLTVNSFVSELDRAILDGLNAHARTHVSALVDRDMLGNIFQYVSERWIFEEGHRDRGLDSLTEVLRKRLADLTTSIEDAEDRHSEWLNSNFTVIALVFTLYQVIPFESGVKLLPGTVQNDDLNLFGVVLLVAAGLALVPPFLWRRVVALTYMRALGHVARKLDPRSLLPS